MKKYKIIGDLKFGEQIERSFQTEINNKKQAKPHPRINPWVRHLDCKRNIYPQRFAV